MKKGRIIIGVISTLLSVSALLNSYTYFDSQPINTVLVYTTLGFIGISGSILAILNNNRAKWLLIIFYAAQSIFIYGIHFQFAFNPGLAFPLGFFDGTLPGSLANPNGFSINILSIAMLIASYKLFTPKSQKIDPHRNGSGWGKN